MSHPQSIVYVLVGNHGTKIMPFIPRQPHPFAQLKRQKCVSGWMIRDKEQSFHNSPNEFMFVAGSNLFSTPEEAIQFSEYQQLELGLR